MKCQCPFFPEDSEQIECPTHHGRQMTRKQWNQCRSSDAFFDGFARLKGRCTGLGDAVARMTRATGIQAAVNVVAKLRGKPCGCGGRQDKLNAALPFRTAGAAESESPAAGPTLPQRDTSRPHNPEAG